jgi:hypothetical protein
METFPPKNVWLDRVKFSILLSLQIPAYALSLLIFIFFIKTVVFYVHHRIQHYSFYLLSISYNFQSVYHFIFVFIFLVMSVHRHLPFVLSGLLLISHSVQ